MSFFDPKSFNPESGKSAFGSITDLFTDIRFKLGSAAYERQLKAADPSSKLKLLRDKVKERDNLVSEMVKLQATAARSARGSISKRYSPGRPDPGKARAVEKNEVKQDNKDAGERKANNPQVIAKAAQIVTAYQKDKDVGNLSTEIQKLYRGSNADLRNDAQEYGYREALSKVLRGAGIPNAIIQQAKDENPLVISRTDQELFEQGAQASGLTRGQEDYYRSQRTGGTSISQRMGTPIDISKELKFFKDRVEQLDSEIEELNEDYKVASQEYERLLRGPDRNLMTAPVAFRPSRTGEIIDAFGNLVAQDPRYGRELTAASQEAGRFTAPKPYEQLLSVPGAAGKSAFDVMLDQSGLVSRLGLGSILEGETKTTVTDEDVNLIAGAVSKMRKALGGQMSDTTDLGVMRMGIGGEDSAEDLGVKEAIETFDNLFNEYKDNPEARSEIARDAMNSLQSWENTLTPEIIDKKSRESRPGMAIASTIRKASDEYKNFERTGDARAYRQTLASLYNEVSKTDKDIRGAVGDAVLNELDGYMATNEADRRPGELNFKLSGLADVAEELASREVLGIETYDFEPAKPKSRDIELTAGSTQETDPDKLDF